jgi:hypothetical protein
MKATQLKKKYPKLWDDTYYAMTVTLENIMSQSDVALFKEGHKGCRIDIIAHNATFLTCYEVHKIMKKCQQLPQ